MARRRRTRITLAVALLVAAAVLSWLAAHPGLFAGHISRLVTRNLLRGTGATFHCQGLDGSLLSRVVFRGVTVTRSGEDGSFLYVTADSVVVGYDRSTLWQSTPVFHEIEIGRLTALLRKGPAREVDEAEKRRGTLFTGLPRVVVERAAIHDGSVTISAADGTLRQELHALQWEGAAEPVEDGLLVRTDLGYGKWPSRDLNIHGVRTEAVLTPGQIQLRGLHAVLDSTRAQADLRLGFQGKHLAEMDIDGHTESFLLSEVLRLIGETAEVPRVRWRGDTRVRMRDDRLHIETTGEGWLDDAPVAARRMVGVLSRTDLVFEELDGRYRSAVGTATGRLVLTPPVLTLRGKVRQADLHDPWTGVPLDWPHTRLQADAQIRLDLDPQQSAVDLQLENIRGSLEHLPVDSARVDLHWSLAEGLEIRHAELTSMRAHLRARGTVDAQERAEILVFATADTLDAWAQEVQLPLRAGGLVAAGRLHGPIDSLQLRMGGTVERVGAGTLVSRRNQVLLRMPRVDDPTRLNLEMIGEELAVGPRALGALRLDLERRAPVTEFTQLRVSVPDSSLRARGRLIEFAGGALGIEVDSLALDLGSDQWRLEQPVVARMDSLGFATQGISLRSATGSLDFVGGVKPAGGLDVDIAVVDADLSLLERVGAVPAIAGHVDLQARLDGFLRDPQFHVELDGRELTLDGRRASSLSLVVDIDGADFDVRALHLQSPDGEADARGRLRAPVEGWLVDLQRGKRSLPELWSRTDLALAVRAQGIELGQWMDPALPAGRYGRVDAELGWSGPAASPTTTGHLTLHDLPAVPFVFPRIEGEIRGDSTGVRLTAGEIDLGGPVARLEAAMPLRVSLAGPSVYHPADGLDLLIDTVGEIDLSTLDAIWPDLRRVAGRGRIRFRAQGDPRRPTLSGEVEFREAEVELEGWSEQLRAFDLHGTLADSVLTLDRLQAREGAKGRIEGEGEILFRGLLPDDLDLRLRAERIFVGTVPFLRAIATSDDLHLTLERPSEGVPRAPMITGSVVVDKAIYTGSFAETGETDPALLPTTSPDWMADLRIRLQDQVRISNASAELRVAGDVTLLRDTQGLRLRGTVEIPQGRVPLFNNDFIITEGTLDFSRRPLEPEIDIFAETTVPIDDPSGVFGRELEKVTVHLTGSFSEPTVEFTSESGLDRTSILRLLAGFGPTETDVRPTSGLTDVGLRAGLNFLERALATQIEGIDTIDIETEEAGLDQMGGTRISVGKYLSNSLYLRYTQGLSVTERDIFLEYQMSRRTLFTSELRRRLRENGAVNEFNLDLKFRLKY